MTAKSRHMLAQNFTALALTAVTRCTVVLRRYGCHAHLDNQQEVNMNTRTNAGIQAV
jgi:hypothetical protein